MASTPMLLQMLMLPHLGIYLPIWLRQPHYRPKEETQWADGV